jgi:signal peptidase I
MTEALEDESPQQVPETPTEDPPKRKSRWRSSRFELPLLVLIALLIALVVKALLVQVFYIPSGSMEPTLHGCPGCRADRVLVNKFVYHTRDPRRGEVIVFKGPPSWQLELPKTTSSNPVSRLFHTLGSPIGLASPNSEDLIKRVIAVGGDHVTCDGVGPVKVNNIALSEPYIAAGAKPSELKVDVLVPKGRLWVMGDNRGDSADSRSHMGDHDGTIPVSDVVGRAFLVIWSPSHIKTLPVPKTFDQPGL